MDAKKNTSTARRPGLHLVISPAQVLALATIAETPSLIEIANGVCDRYGYERLDELMEAVDDEN